MRVNNEGKLMKYLATQDGIVAISEDSHIFDSSDLPIFEEFESAALYIIEHLSIKVNDLQDELGLIKRKLGL